MLHYYAAKFFAPVIIVPELQPNGDLIIFGISDLTYKISGRLSIYLYSWDSMDYLNNQEQRVYLVSYSIPTYWLIINFLLKFFSYRHIPPALSSKQFLYPKCGKN